MNLTNAIFSFSGVTIEFTYKNPYFTAYITESILTFDSIISKLHML